jgi:hypothetical protein
MFQRVGKKEPPSPIRGLLRLLFGIPQMFA